MRHKLSALFLSAFLAMSIVACDDILLPDDPWDPGNGGGGDTTENPVDTVNDDTTGNHDRLVVNGTFVSMDPQDPNLPEGSRLTVLWFRADGSTVAYGNGEILPNNKWRIEVGGQLPVNAYYDDPVGGHTYAVGHIALVRDDTPIGVPGMYGAYGTSAEFSVIYDTDEPTNDPWGMQFLELFPRGYMLGEMVEDGQPFMPPYLPVQNDDVILRHTTF
jgi:hypothetical protein